MTDGGSQQTAASSKRPDTLLATWAAGPWKPTASQPGDSASHPSSPPSGAPPAPVSAAGAASTGGGGPTAAPGTHLAEPQPADGHSLPPESAGLVGGGRKSRFINLAALAHLLLLEAPPLRLAPTASQAGAYQRPRPPPERSDRPGPARRQDRLRSVGAAAPPAPTPGPAAPHPPRREKARRARTATAPAPTAPSPAIYESMFSSP